MIKSFITGRLFVPAFCLIVGLMALAGIIESDILAGIAILPLMIMTQAFFYRLDLKILAHNNSKLKW